MTTFADLIFRATVELRQEPGVSVQQYAEDVIAAIMQRVFNTFFDHYWWPAYTTSANFTLNGVDGRVVEYLAKTIKRIDDVRYIWLENDVAPLAAKPPMVNPNNVGFRRYYEATNDDRIFRIWPGNTTGKVAVTYRTKPEPFKPNDVVMMDEDLLVLATCFNYLADDEDAPNAIKKFSEATAKREAQIREVFNRGPIPFGAPAASPMTDWMTL